VFQRSRTLELDAAWTLTALAEAGRGARRERVLFDGRGDDRNAWRRPGLVGLAPACLLRLEDRDAVVVEAALDRIRRELDARRGSGLDGTTGLAILLGYECLSPGEGCSAEEPFPTMLVFSVDSSIIVDPSGSARLTVRAAGRDNLEAELAHWSQRLQ